MLHVYVPSIGKVSLVEKLVIVVCRRILLQHTQLLLVHGVVEDWATVSGGVSVGVMSVVLVVIVLGNFARTRVSLRFFDRLKAILGRVGNTLLSVGSLSIMFQRWCIDFFRVGNHGSYGITSVSGGSLIWLGTVGVSGSGILLINSVRFSKGNV